MGRKSAVRGPGAVGTAMRTGRRVRHSMLRMRGAASAADARRPEGAVIMRPGIPGGNVAAAVDAPDDVDGHACGGIGVNGPAACGIAPDRESGGVIQGLTCPPGAMRISPCRWIPASATEGGKARRANRALPAQ